MGRDKLTLQEISCTPTHSRMDVGLKMLKPGIARTGVKGYLRGFDMIVEVISEGLDVRDNIIASLPS